jgi:hypothetical protein
MIKEETEAPIYNMILEQEAIELHKLATLITSHGGSLLDLSTDSVSCFFKDDQLPFKTIEQDDKTLIQGFYYDDNEQNYKYKLEDKDRLKYPRMANFNREDTYK